MLNQKNLIGAIVSAILLLCIHSSSAQLSVYPSVVTDKDDYAPSETALITASGFEPGESVEFLVLHIDGVPNSGGGHDPWQITDGSSEDFDGTVNGVIETSWFVNPDDSFNSTFELTALGLSSGLSASHVFTDDTPIPTGVSATYNSVTDVLTVTVDWQWLCPENDEKVTAVAVFADLNGDGLTPDATDNPNSWVASSSSGNGNGIDLAIPSDEFLGQLASSSIVGTTETGDATGSGISAAAFNFAGIDANTPQVLFPYDLAPQIDQGCSGTFTLTYTGVTLMPQSICVITYDIHTDGGTDVPTPGDGGSIDDFDGNHSPISAGNDHNTDNSLEAGFAGTQVACDDPEAQIIFVDLALDKTVDDAYPEVGQIITFSLTVTNESLLPSSSGFTVEDVLPAGYTYVNDFGVPGNDFDNATNIWTYDGNIAGLLTGGSSVTINIEATVNGSGPYNNYAQIATDNEDDPDSIPGDDSIDQDDDATVIVSPCTGDANPCNAIRWEGGSTWNVDSSIDDTPSGNDGIPNMAPVNGIIRCGSSAETQSNIQSTGCYDPGDFSVDISGFSCVEPSSGVEVFPLNPTPGQPLIWLNFDVRALAGTFQVQINDNSGDNIAWALYYAGSPQEGVTLNPITGEYLSGDCNDLTLAACGVESANTWNTLPVPNFLSVTNYYMVVWDQDADGNLGINNFKARYGCGDASVVLCNILLDGVDTECNGDGTYTVNVNVSGINGEYVAFDANALQNPSDPICLTNSGDDPAVTSGTMSMTYNDGQMYSITVAEVTPSTMTGCAEPLNTDDCILTGISGMPPVCCELEIECPGDLSFQCEDDVPAGSVDDVVILNSCGTVAVNINDQSIGAGCVGDPLIITRTYTVTDGSDSIECVRTLTVIDTTNPIISCPVDFDVTCTSGSIDSADTGIATATDNCDTAPIITFVDGPISSNCPSSFTRTWTATDACGNSDSCDQLISINDETDPVITCPADATVECDGDTSVAANGSATATDNCDTNPTITFSDIEAPGSCPNEWTITRTWTATDACGNSSSCEQLITISDTTPPTADNPQLPLLVECNNIPAPANVTFSDNCDTDVFVTYLEVPEVVDACTTLITRIWIGTDDCGNQGQTNQLVTVIDSTVPVIVCPANATVECGPQVCTDPSCTGSATANDNCSGVTISHTDSSAPGCGNTEVITRTWTATDACGNSSSCEQLITISDTTPPTADNPQLPLLVECNNIPAPANVTFSDNCDTDVFVTYLEVPEVVDACTTLITRIWIGTDDCGNQGQTNQLVTVVDSTSPVITCPADVTVECDGDTSVAANGSATATDNCDTNPTITFSDIEAPGSCPNEWTITRTWTAIDACGNTDSCDQIIEVVDNTKPVITCPADFDVVCTSGSTDPADTGIATATDNCDTAPIITFVDGPISGNCPSSFTRTWTATDACGNSDSCDQLISINDETDPVITCPADATVECDGDTSVAANGSATATDNCDTNPTITFSDVEAPGSCPNEWTITRTWTATDACGNSDSCDQLIHVVDTTPPSITCPSDYIGDCNASTDPSNTGVATGSDTCGTVAITFNDTEVSGCGNTTLITRTWTAIDLCGNTASCEQLIYTNDIVAPVIVCPSSVTLECGPGACTDTQCTGMATATDNCGSASISFSDTSVPGCGNTEEITRTWTATDACGNTSSCTQTISVVDLTPPVLSGLPENQDLDCLYEIPEPANVTASDVCDSNPVLDFDENIDDSSCPIVITRTWTATDACGNTAAYTQTINIGDDTAPVIDPFPTYISVECDEIDDLTIEASDECGEPTITFEDILFSGGCLGVLERTWFATDYCGNVTSAIQFITITDTTPPAIIGVGSDMDLDCTETAEFPVVTAADNCGDEVTLEFEEEIIAGNCPQNYTVIWTWTATDYCDNVAEESMTIQHSDTTPPSFDEGPQNGAYSCEETVPASEEPIASDDCGIVSMSFIENTIDGDCPNTYTIVRTWTATDQCGNSSEYVQNIEISDETDPEFTFIPSDVTIDCDDTIPTDEATADDNCGNVLVTSSDEYILTECATEYTIIRTFFAEDDCENVATAQQVITIEDNDAPILSESPEDLVLDCEAEVPAPPVLTAFDACEGPIVVDFNETFEGDFPDPEAENDCVLIHPNSVHYDPDWAVWLQNLPVEYQFYELIEGSWKDYADGSAHLEVKVVSTDNENAGWDIDVWFYNGMDWDSWSNQDFATSYKDDFNEAGLNYLDWMYYLMNNDMAVMSGWGDFEGSLLNLQHAPSSNYYGYQVGVAANNVNSNYGSGGWFTYDGILIDASSDYNEEVNAAGDFAFEHDCCLQYEIIWTWTATDCAGNTATEEMVVSFEDLGGIDPGPIAACPTDFNGNGGVGSDDLLVFLSEFGCADNCACDLDGDGDVDTSDMLIFLPSFGSHCD